LTKTMIPSPSSESRSIDQVFLKSMNVSPVPLNGPLNGPVAIHSGAKPSTPRSGHSSSSTSQRSSSRTNSSHAAQARVKGITAAELTKQCWILIIQILVCSLIVIIPNHPHLRSASAVWCF
jgi:hypothetical protein